MASKPVVGGVNTVTQSDFVHELKVHANRYNDGCGGHVWAIGNLGNATNLISLVPPTAEHLDGYDVTALSIVFFDIFPCGAHPWHIHQNMNEYVFVTAGSGRVSIMNPVDLSVEILSVEPGDLVTLPVSHMHQFEASTDGLQLVAFANVNHAHLALVPTYMAMQPEPVQRMLSNDGASDRFFSQGYSWETNMPPGDAFICANITEDNTGAGCRITPRAPSLFCTYDDGVQTCNATLASDAKYSAPFYNIATCGPNMNSGNASTGCTCQFDGALCQLQPTSSINTPMFYARLQLSGGEMLGPAQQARGGIGGYVTKGRIWVLVFSPNQAYASQFKALEGEAFYVPPDVYVNILGMDDENEAVLGVSKKQGQDNEVGVLVPFGPAINTVIPGVLQGYFGWDRDTAIAFAESNHSALGGKSFVPEMIAYAEALQPDQVLCPTTNGFCTSDVPVGNVEVVYGAVVSPASDTDEELDSTRSLAIAGVVLGALNLAALLAILFALLIQKRNARASSTGADEPGVEKTGAVEEEGQ